MPTSAFVQGVERNLRYWQAQCVPFSEEVLELFSQEQPNLQQALQVGLAFPATQVEALQLTLALFECVEARGGWREWLPLLERALTAEECVGLMRISLLNQLGFAHTLSGACERAEPYHQEAETLSHAQASPLGLANAWFGLAQVAFAKHQYPSAERYCQQALEKFEQGAEQKKVSIVHNLCGRIALEKGAYIEAEIQFQSVVTLRRQLGPVPFLVQALNNLALALQAQKKFSEALAIYQEALALLPVGQSPLIKVGVQNSLGALYFALEAYAEAEQTFQTIDAHYLHRVGADLWLASRANNLGNVYLKLGQWMLAETYLAKAVTYWRQLEHEINLANTLGDLVDAMIAQQRLLEAREFYEEAVQLLEKYPQNAWARDRLARLTVQRQKIQ